MKDLNIYFSKLFSPGKDLQSSDVSTTLALTVGSPSVHRRVTVGIDSTKYVKISHDCILFFIICDYKIFFNSAIRSPLISVKAKSFFPASFSDAPIKYIV